MAANVTHLRVTLERIRIARLTRLWQNVVYDPNQHPKGADGKYIATEHDAKDHGAGEIKMIPLHQIHAGLNPREYFDPAKLAELKASIKAEGLLQPISVRPHENGYQIIAGERRYRAIQDLGFTHAPAIVHHVDDQTARKLALIENVTRADMTPTETGRAYKALMGTGMSIKDIATQTGKGEDHIKAHLALVTLPDHLQSLVDKEQIPLGIVGKLAKLSPAGQEEAAGRIVQDGLAAKSANRLINVIAQREAQTTLFDEVKPVTQVERDAKAKYDEAITKATDLFSKLDDPTMAATARALESPGKEAERLLLMIKQLQRMHGVLETESYRRSGKPPAPKAAKPRKKKSA